MGNISVSKDFNAFCSNLKLSNTTISNIRTRYHAITKRIDQDFWNSNSKTTYDNYSGNGQSALLQVVKNSLRTTYRNSNLSADGQVIDIFFSDEIKFEVVLAFLMKAGHSICASQIF